jgi:glycosyltransferase involved in cell wall biosynthesis
MRLAAYTDYTYRRVAGQIYAERAFALFLARLGEELDRLVIVGKVDSQPGATRYPLPPGTGFVELPYYASLARPVEALVAMARSLAAFWRVLDEVDGAWLLGPHPLALAFALLALMRGKTVVLGVRQDFPRYVRARHPDRRWMHWTADLLDAAWRTLARFVPVVVVGPALAASYRPETTLEIAVSLVREQDIAPASVDAHRSYLDGELRVLSVGRLEEEKNPLLLADAIAMLRSRDPRWRLLVCGEGPLEDALRRRLDELGVAEHAELLGYVAHDGGLRDVYRSSHALLHVSWTEGVPQVLFEAFAARLPVVATAVGGVRAAAEGSALLIAPGDPAAAVNALERLRSDPVLRSALIDAGALRVRERTLDAEARRVADFLSLTLRGDPARRHDASLRPDVGRRSARRPPG